MSKNKKENQTKTFTWSGTSVRDGKEKSGELQAANKDVAMAMIRNLGVRDAKVKKVSESIDLIPEKIKSKDITIFFRQLSVMLNAGLPLVQGFELAEKGCDIKPLKKLLSEVRQSLEGGAPLAESMRKHDEFDKLTCSLIKAGEDGGILDDILLRICEYQEKANALKAKLKSAMVYPISILVISFIVTSILMIFVIPVFSEMFADFGAELPAPTQIAMAMSDFFIEYWYIIFSAPVIALMLFKNAYKRSTSFHRAVDKAMLSFPIFGEILRKGAVARFCRTFATLDAAGVPILDAMDTVAETSGNLYLEETVISCKTSISSGRSLSEPLIESGVFPVMVTQMIAIGEQTGALETMMSKIADFYEEEVDTAVDGLTALIEPIIMAFLGVVIGGLVIAMYLPIFQMASVVNG